MGLKNPIVYFVSVSVVLSSFLLSVQAQLQVDITSDVDCVKKATAFYGALYADITVNREEKCYLECLAKKIQFINADGAFNKNATFHSMKSAFADKPDKVILQMVDYCNAELSKEPVSNDDSCKNGFKVWRCIFSKRFEIGWLEEKKGVLSIDDFKKLHDNFKRLGLKVG